MARWVHQAGRDFLFFVLGAAGALAFIHALGQL